MTRHVVCIVLSTILLGATACTPPVEAPAELSDLTLWLFANFEADTGAELAAGALSLEEYLVTVDLEASAKDRSVTLPVLKGESLGSVTAPPDADPEVQVPIGVTARSAYGIDSSLELITDPNQVCIANNGYKYYSRDFTSDTGCFLDGTCDRLDATAEIRYESLLADVWFDEVQEFRRVELEDGRVAAYQRGWAEQQFLSDNEAASWDQRFTLNVWIPDPDDSSRTYRFLAFWSSVQIPGITDDAYSNLVLDGIDEGFENEDAFIAGEDCSNDRDREYDRP